MGDLSSDFSPCIHLEFLNELLRHHTRFSCNTLAGHPENILTYLTSPGNNLEAYSRLTDSMRELS
jgi:hypothetical protein